MRSPSNLGFNVSRQGAGVAQLVEQRFRKPQVARSIRVAGSKPRLRVPRALHCFIELDARG